MSEGRLDDPGFEDDPEAASMGSEEPEGLEDGAWRSTIASPRQERAAHLKALGRSDAEIAKELNVSRETIWRWRNHPGFRLRVSQLQAGAAEAAANAFGDMVRLSVELMKKEVEQGNWQAASQVLRLVGPQLVAAYATRKPTEVDEVLAVLGFEHQSRLDFASVIRKGARPKLLQWLAERSSREELEEFRNRLLFEAAAITSELGRSPDPLPGRLPRICSR